VLIFACFAVLGVQTVYLGLFLVEFMRKRDTAPVSPIPPVSVIVCAHDEEQNLRELIPLLLAQDHPEFEIIVVEDRCNDGTLDYLMEVTQQYPTVRMVKVNHVPDHVHGKKFGLTLGIKAARYEWLLLTDADCRPATLHWIRSMSSGFYDATSLVLGFSSYIKRPGLLNAFIRFETLLTAVQYIGFAWTGFPYMGVGRNLAYRKSLFLANKGFNEYLGVVGGDDDLFVNRHATRQNTGVVVGSESLVYSQPKSTVREFYYQKLRHLSVGKQYKRTTKWQLGFFSLTWILTWVLVWPAAATTPFGYAIAGVWCLRWAVMSLLLQIASRKMGDPFEAWKTPFLDFIYAFYYLVTGAIALVSKKVRWKI
jgi:cellulose synthase/poly-beta-1,6-N-acetylglucosamine synthase-like glycosyltransferase